MSFLQQPCTTKKINNTSIVLNLWCYPIFIHHSFETFHPLCHYASMTISIQDCQECYLIWPKTLLLHPIQSFHNLPCLPMISVTSYHCRPSFYILILHLIKNVNRLV
ncbi:hypothetical protein Csa_000468 [Cucumis sativus]|uniref:Uncharacterized protein n=1 Tax=Cucumis sativus TaxID=3659 RepID=A0A0A0KN59_CUCSA|nr:hypothetical protein Csa_000468 [Cucumis sativus]